MESYKKFDRSLAWSLVKWEKGRDRDTKDMNIDELFEYLYWEYITMDSVMDNYYIKMLLANYGKNLLGLVKQYIKETNNYYDMGDEQKEAFIRIKNELSLKEERQEENNTGLIINISATLSGKEEIDKAIDELQAKLNNLKINISL
jgi:hypothetical protein